MLNIPIRRSIDTAAAYPPDPGPDFPSPADFGLPARYDHWRPRQWAAVSQIVNSPKRFFVLCAATGSGKSVTAMASAMLGSSKRVAYLTATKGLQDQLCHALGTKVLTGDLRWIPIETVNIGDTLLGFDEERTDGSRRRWRPSLVEEIRVFKAPCYRLMLADGTETVCTAEHKWLVHKSGSVTEWSRTDHLRIGGKYTSKLARLLDVWDADKSYDAGYLAAAFDGEGHLHQSDWVSKGRQGKPGKTVDINLAMSQTFNPMLERVLGYLRAKGFHFHSSITCPKKESYKPYETIGISYRRDIIRFLGQIRPVRLLSGLHLDRLGMIGPISEIPVIAREYIGDQTVIAMRTSTRTFVADGFGSHNCNDFGSLVHDVRGMGNYRCSIAERLGMSKWTMVNDAACQMGYGCELKRIGGCEYYDHYRQAQRAKMLCGNYMVWMYDALKDTNAIHIPRWEYEVNREHGFNDTDNRTPVDMLICDEADKAGEWVSKFVGVDITRAECLALRLVWPDAGLVLGDWHGWAKELVGGLGERVKALEKSMRERARAGRGDDAWSGELRMLRDFHRKLQRLSTIHVDEDWVLDERMSEDAGAGRSLKAIRFEPLSPGRYAEQVLWRGVEKVVLMSATVREKTANLLGIGNDEMEFAEYPSTFDPKRRPVIFVPSVRMNYRNEQNDTLMHLHLARIDQIIKGRLDRKGLIHAVSYKRAEFIRDNSDYGQYMIIHNSHNRAEAVERFRQAAPPAIIISPSLDTGYSFDDDECRYVIIAKIPFASIQDKIVKARQERDPEYGLFLAAQNLVQMSGRAVRSSGDWSETLIVDDNFSWFRHQARAFIPSWWWDAVQDATVVPKPLMIE